MTKFTSAIDILSQHNWMNHCRKEVSA